ncbi:MAG: YggS family pyridoxal phosphate-dependent enzyme [Trueperaceae bacterium]
MSLATVRARIEAACARSGRDPSEVRLVAVSKGRSPEEIDRALLRHGVRDLGENRVQAWRDKAVELPTDVRWHFVGNLQRNKVKYLADGGVTWVHSLNSLRLARALSAQGERVDHRFTALIEVDVAREAAKQGAPAGEVPDLLEACRDLPNLTVVGLMAMAPFRDDPETVRPVFRELVALADRLQLPERSIGMSRDLEVAIEEGATIVRVGTALFEPDARDAAASPPAATEEA